LPKKIPPGISGGKDFFGAKCNWFFLDWNGFLMDLGFCSFHRSGSIIYVKRIFLIVLDFQSALDFLGFSGTGCLVSPVCDFGGFSRFGFGFCWILDFIGFFLGR
jgi:hypothetical protein